VTDGIRPTTCVYCDGHGNSDAGGECGFCDQGLPLDTQENWDNTWGRVFDLIGRDYCDFCGDEHDGPCDPYGNGTLVPSNHWGAGCPADCDVHGGDDA
jgi:hypothetical protein